MVLLHSKISFKPETRDNTFADTLARWLGLVWSSFLAKMIYQISVLLLYKIWIKFQEIQFQIIYLLCDFKDTMIIKSKMEAEEIKNRRILKKPNHISLLFNRDTLRVLLKQGAGSMDENHSWKNTSRQERIKGILDVVLQIINYTKSTNLCTTISLYDQFGT